MANAGEGNLEISIASDDDGQNIQNRVRQLGQGRFEVVYTPMVGGDHSASVTFNGEHVKGMMVNWLTSVNVCFNLFTADFENLLLIACLAL